MSVRGDVEAEPELDSESLEEDEAEEEFDSDEPEEMDEAASSETEAEEEVIDSGLIAVDVVELVER